MDELHDLLLEFERNAANAGGLTHTTVWSNVDWVEEDVADPNWLVRTPTEFTWIGSPYPFPPFVSELAWESALRDPQNLAHLYRSRGGGDIRFHIRRHFIDVSDWINGPPLAEGGFWIDAWPKDGASWGPFVDLFWDLATCAGDTFRDQLPVAQNSGEAWIKGLYEECGTPFFIPKRSPYEAFSDERLSELTPENREIQQRHDEMMVPLANDCGWSWTRAKGHEFLKQRLDAVERFAASSTQVRRLRLPVFAASASLLRSLRDATPNTERNPSQVPLVCEWYHRPDEEVPAEYCRNRNPVDGPFQPVSGNETELAFGFTGSKRNENLRPLAKRGELFVVQQSRRHFLAYVKHDGAAKRSTAISRIQVYREEKRRKSGE